MERKAIGNRIKELRMNKAFLSQEEFAKKINIDRTYMCRIESGEKNLTIETLMKICDGLGVSLKEFFDF